MVEKKSRPIKVTIVGDGNIGKTCLLMCYTYSVFPTTHVPTVFDTFGVDDVPPVELCGQTFQLTLWDTAGQEDYDRLRPISYPNTDVFLVCYTVDNRTSLKNIKSKWIRELRHYCPQVPFVLVATKIDKRATGNKLITTAEGIKLSNSIGAAKFVECSALTGENLKKVFEEAVIAALEDAPVKNCACSLM